MMPQRFTYAGHFLAGCLDFAMGVLIVSILGALFYIEVPLWAYPLGAFLAMLPDMDILWDVLRGSDLLGWDHHQTILHRPLAVLPVVTGLGALLGVLLGNPLFFACVFFSCVLWHYIHDTKGLAPEGGIAWAWPFSRYYLSLFGKEEPAQSRTRETPFYLEWIHPTALSVRELFFAFLFLTLAPIFDLQLTEWVIVGLPLFAVLVCTVWVTAPSKER